MQLADATLPTGGFAHSGGIEAAYQLGILTSDGSRQGRDLPLHRQVKSFVLSAARSNNRLQGAFAAAAHDVSNNLAEWTLLDARLQAHLATNAAAFRASAQQGAALVRALTYWPAPNSEVALPRPLRGHLATVFGLAAARLGLSRDAALQALAHCTVRDLLSAAVRLNLVGPLYAVGLQAEIMAELEPDLLEVAAQQGSIDNAASSSPMVDCAQAAHDLLHARMFLT